MKANNILLAQFVNQFSGACWLATTLQVCWTQLMNTSVPHKRWVFLELRVTTVSAVNILQKAHTHTHNKKYNVTRLRIKGIQTGHRKLKGLRNLNTDTPIRRMSIYNLIQWNKLSNMQSKQRNCFVKLRSICSNCIIWLFYGTLTVVRLKSNWPCRHIYLIIYLQSLWLGTFPWHLSILFDDMKNIFLEYN